MTDQRERFEEKGGAISMTPRQWVKLEQIFEKVA